MNIKRTAKKVEKAVNNSCKKAGRAVGIVAGKATNPIRHTCKGVKEGFKKSF